MPRRGKRFLSIAFSISAALMALVALIARGNGDGGVNVDLQTTAVYSSGAGRAGCPKADGSSPRTLQFASAPPMCLDAAKTYTAHVVTSEGDYDIALDTDKTPHTVNNFVFLSRYHYYDNTTIFRIDDAIEIIQTGSPHTDTFSDPGPGYTIKDEGAGFQYNEGDVVMARSQARDSGSAQYFLVYGSKGSLLNPQGTYVTFGRVSGAGLAVLKKIGALHEPCRPGEQTCLGGRPSRRVTIESVTISES